MPTAVLLLLLALASQHHANGEGGSPRTLTSTTQETIPPNYDVAALLNNGSMRGNAPANVPTSLLPKLLLSKHPGPVPQTKWTPFHWVITTCNTRRKWGRMLTSTLLSGLLNGLQPASINIVFCRSGMDKHLPSLLYNLRHSHSLNVWFAQDFPSYKGHPLEEKIGKFPEYWKITLTALLVPSMLGAEDIPLLMTEDDVVFTSDANARISLGVQQVEAQVNGEPYFLHLYNHSEAFKIENSDNGTLPQAPLHTGRDEQRVHLAHTPTVVRRITWGFQAAFFSPGLIPICLKDVLTLVSTPEKSVIIWYADAVVNLSLKRRGCNNPGVPCHSFVMTPSVVQHIGTTSATFQKGAFNANFHMGEQYPNQVAFPGMEHDDMW